MGKRFIDGVAPFFEAMDRAMDAPFKGKEVVEKDTLLLPYAVRRELESSKDGHISREALEELVRNPQLLDQSIYLMMKVFDTDPERQQQLLQALSNVEERNPDEIQPMQDILISFFETLPRDTTVQATKLAQISRQGFNTWSDAYSEAAYQWDEQYEGRPEPFLVGYATFGGLRKFLDAFRHDERDLHLLIPKWIDDQDTAYCGYRIHTDGNHLEVSFTPKDFERPAHAVILDDTIASGKGMRQLEAFWMQEPGASPPVLDSIIVSPQHNK